MLNVRRIVRDYQDAGSVNSLIAVWGFVDEETFITKAGHLGVVYHVAGVDYECLDQAQRRDVVHRFEAALRLLDESCRVYQYLCKRRIEPIAGPVPIKLQFVQPAVRIIGQGFGPKKQHWLDETSLDRHRPKFSRAL